MEHRDGGARSARTDTHTPMIRDGQLIYIEHKSGHGDAGPAWITRARLSKSGRTIYFDGRALKRRPGGGVSGNHYCSETGDEFWISGVKRDGSNRHWAGTGVVMVDHRVVREYLTFRGLDELDPAAYRIVADLAETDVSRFHDRENEPP